MVLLLFVQPIMAQSYLDKTYDNLVKSGYSQTTAAAILALHKELLDDLQKKQPGKYQALERNLVNLAQYRLDYFLEQHPETAGLFIENIDHKTLKGILDYPNCYQHLLNYYLLFPNQTTLISNILSKNKNLFCQYSKLGLTWVIGFYFYPANATSPSYPLWLTQTLVSLLNEEAEKRLQVLAFLQIQQDSLRLRFEEREFAENFSFVWREFLQGQNWDLQVQLDALEANDATTEQILPFMALAHDPYLFDLLLLPDGQEILDKHGAMATELLFGATAYPAALRGRILTLLRRDYANEVRTALYLFRQNPAFHHLLNKPINQAYEKQLLLDIITSCQEYPQGCPRIDYLASLSPQNIVQELKPEPSGVITWIPGYSLVHTSGKLLAGRQVSAGDWLMASMDVAALVGAGMALKAGTKLAANSARALNTAGRLRKIAQAKKAAPVWKQLATGQFRIDDLLQQTYKKIPVLNYQTMKKIGLEPRLFMRKDAVVVINAQGAYQKLLQETAENALREISQQAGSPTVIRNAIHVAERTKQGIKFAEIAAQFPAVQKNHALWFTLNALFK